VNSARDDLFCVLPAVREDRPMMDWIKAQNLRIGPPLVSVPRTGDLSPWTLHRLNKSKDER
jgi:hypothetical protein